MGTVNIIVAFLIIGICVRSGSGQAVDTYAAETSLRSTLSSGYDTTVRPSTPTTVYIYYSVKSLRSLDITTQTMSLASWTTMYWTDPRLTWTPASHSGISELDVNFAWKPEYGIVNAVGDMAYFGADTSETRLRVFNTGEVRWMQFMGSETQCEVDIAKFPFDTQTCSVEIVFWGSSTTDVTFNVTMTTINTMRYVANGEWMLDSSSVSSMDVDFCCPSSTHKMFFFTFTYSRLQPFYTMNIIVPSILLSICSIWVFYLPTESGERLGFSLTILLSYTVQMSITAAMMPTTSKQVPHIAMYLLIVLVLCTLLLCNVVLHVRIYYKEGTPPDYVKKMYRRIFPIVFCIGFPKCLGKKGETKVSAVKPKPNNKLDIYEEELAGEPVKDRKAFEDHKKIGEKEGIDDEEEITWMKVSMWMDRCCFFFYLTMIVILTLYLIITLNS